MSQSPAQPSPQQKMWDLVAPSYAQDVWQWLDYAREALRMLPVTPSDRVLDLACGPGTVAFLAAPHVSRVDAVDFSPVMIEELRARAARDRVSNVDAAVMDAQSLAFPDETFDVAFCLFAFFFFPDRAKGFRELRRVLRPGGRALVATWGPIERRPLMKVGFDAIAEALPDMPRPAKGELQHPEDCVREMTEAGFRDVTPKIFTASARMKSPEHYLEIMKGSGPFVSLKQKLGEEGFASAMTRVLDALRPRFAAGGVDLSAEAILTVATR